jgi:hypothetical protein
VQGYRVAALVAFAGVALAACGGGSARTPTPTATATTSGQATATATPAPAAAAVDPLDWRSSTHSGQPVGLVRARSGFFGVETRAVAALSRSGAFRWRYQGPRTDDFRGFVVKGIPVAAVRPHAVKGLDPGTGRVRWSHPSSRYAFTDGRRVYAPTCTGAQTGALGECTLTAYDPRTGAAQWSAPVFANVEESQTGSGVLVVQTFPTGDRPRFLVLDPAGGTIRASVDVPEDHYLSLVGRHLVDPGENSSSARSQCNARATGYGLDGAVVWRRVLELGRDRSKRCDAYLASAVGGDAALNAIKGRALLLDPATGRTIWSGPRGAVIEGEAGGHLVVQPADRNRTIGVDRGSLTTTWTYRGITGPWLAWRGYAATNTACDERGAACTLVLDGRTGERVLMVRGVPESFVPARNGNQPPGLMTRIDDRKRYAARYGYVTLP